MTGSDKAKTIDALVTVSANDNFDGIINDIQALWRAAMVPIKLKL